MTDRLDAMRSRVDGVCDAFVEDPSWDSCRHCFKSLGDDKDHTICRMLETAEARIVELEAERDAFRAEIRDVIGYLEEPHDTGR